MTKATDQQIRDYVRRQAAQNDTVTAQYLDARAMDQARREQDMNLKRWQADQARERAAREARRQELLKQDEIEAKEREEARQAALEAELEPARARHYAEWAVDHPGRGETYFNVNVWPHIRETHYSREARIAAAEAKLRSSSLYAI